MEPWKGMLWLAFVFVSFAVFAELANVSLTSSTGLGILIGLIIFAVISYVGTTKGYQIGRSIGEKKRKERK